MNNELPVQLIQALLARQAFVQARLDTLARYRAEEATYRNELADIVALLAAYPLPERTNGTHDTAEVASPPQTLEDHITALLDERGPSQAAYIGRMLRLTHGVTVPSSTLYEHLQRGMKRGIYDKTRGLWRLASTPTEARHAG